MSAVQAMPAWGEVQISRFNFRVGLFQRRGLDIDHAEQVADRMATRDYERDDRRLCIECAHLQHNGACFVAAQGKLAGATAKHKPVRDILQRCPSFTFQKP